MPKLVCVDCNKEYKPETNGVIVVEMFSQPPTPYKLWRADLWKCPGCGKEIVAGFAEECFAIHHSSDIPEILKHRKKLGIRIIYDYEWRR